MLSDFGNELPILKRCYLITCICVTGVTVHVEDPLAVVVCLPGAAATVGRLIMDEMRSLMRMGESFLLFKHLQSLIFFFITLNM